MIKKQLSRRKFIEAIGLGTLACIAPSLAIFADTPNPSTKKPYNVLFIVIDDLNDWIGCLGGHPDVKTPNLDKLAQRGMLFTKTYCPAPACNPSRAAVMTGIRPSTSGVYTNPQPWRKSPVLKDAVTLPQHFMAHGYTTKGSGKIYHGGFPDPASWNEYWPSQTKNKPKDPGPSRKEKPLNGIPKTNHFDWGPLKAAPQDMGDWKVSDWVIGQLNKKHDKPLFLGCGFYRPHLPWYVPQKYFDLYPLDAITMPTVNENDLDDIPSAGKRIAKPHKDYAKVLKYKQWRKAVQAYLASISFADECVGRVIDALNKSAYKDNTIIVLWSDHGWHLGEKLHWRKFALWEEATHNVLMISAPGITKPGEKCDVPVNLIDIYPTLVDICGLIKRPELEGVSLLPLLKNPKAPWDRPSLTTHGRNNHTLRTPEWRYIRYADGSEELYDHTKDPKEWTNLAADKKYTKIKAELKKQLPKKNARFSFIDKDEEETTEDVIDE